MQKAERPEPNAFRLLIDCASPSKMPPDPLREPFIGVSIFAIVQSDV